MLQRIITRSTAGVESQSWQDHLSHAVTDLNELLQLVQIDPADLSMQQQACQSFPLLVPRTLIDRMEVGNANDPLLKQVLPDSRELEQQPSFVHDPLGEQHTNQQPGIIHKYHGRVLILLATGCAVNCRYCFRRHFDYANNRLGKRQWQTMIDYIKADPSITEVILSGGDPLMHKDSDLAQFLQKLEAIPRLSRLRIHSRLPVVIAQRLTDSLANRLAESRLQVSLVLHVNHPNELTAEHQKRLDQWRRRGITLLNQTVLLKGVNDDLQTLVNLSETLFSNGILPYYLHLLDRVQGAAHFDIDEVQIRQLEQQLRARLPGYLMPRFVREIAGENNKSPF